MSGSTSPPDIATLLSTHTLATTIISHHKTPSAVLDARELALLRSFCANPSAKDAILAEQDMHDGPGERPGTRAATHKGSLAGFVIATFGTGELGLSEGEVAELRGWFEGGGEEWGEGPAGLS